MKLQGKKIALLIGPLFEDHEFWVPYYRLLEEGAEVTVIGGDTKTEYPSKHHGVGRKADVASENANSSQFDAVVVPGGFAPDRMRRDPHMTLLVKEMYDAGKIVAMICHAGWVGISAGIVDGHKCTGSTGIRDDIVNAGGTWVNEPAFRDGNIVWGRVVEDIPDFCRLLVEEVAQG